MKNNIKEIIVKTNNETLHCTHHKKLGWFVNKRYKNENIVTCLLSGESKRKMKDLLNKFMN